MLRARGLRVEVDGSSNRMQYKIRAAQEQKVPYMVVLGDREIEARTASPRTRAGEQQEAESTGTSSPTGWPPKSRGPRGGLSRTALAAAVRVDRPVLSIRPRPGTGASCARVAVQTANRNEQGVNHQPRPASQPDDPDPTGPGGR